MTGLLLIAAFASFGAAADYPPDSDCQNHGDGGTLAIAECLGSQSRVWERRLNDEYRAVLERGEVDRGKLRTAERAWLRYRDSNCDSYGSVRGSIRIILTSRCWRDMTRARTLELRDMLWTG